MRLESVQIKNYRSIIDSGAVSVDPAVTCLVGKNESGKTAFLRSLHLLNPLNPLNGKQKFDDVIDFPAKNYGRYKKTRADEPGEVITAGFSLSDSETASLNATFGAEFTTSRDVTVEYGYSATRRFSFHIDEAVAVRTLVADIDLLPDDRARVGSLKTVQEVKTVLDGLAEPQSSVTALIAKIDSWPAKSLRRHVIRDYLMPWLPKFFYFDDYSIMPGRVSIDGIRAKMAAGTLTEGEKTFLAFLGLGGGDLDDFEPGGSTERLIRELENAALNISAEVFEYWTQNSNELQVLVRESQADPEDEDPDLRTGTILNVRINNLRHGASAKFDERSRGFVWFFSFFAFFSDIEREGGGDVILLLDEPGLSLHGSAQSDFLRFIDNRLAESHQVIYTTHSPFMVEPSHFDRVRTVEDSGDLGTKVSGDLFLSEQSTALPLLTKMGVDLFQTLMVGPHTLLVEGPSDHLYLALLTQALQKQGRDGLDERWIVVPVDGAPKLAPFAALYAANHLNVAILMDSSKADKRLIDHINAGAAAESLIRVGDVLSRESADIEDLFNDALYLELVSGAYADALPGPIKTADLESKHPRLIKRVEDHFVKNGVADGDFSHYRPAKFMRDNKARFLPKITDSTLDRAEELFGRINSRL